MYALAGSFCGSPCATATDCGAGYACSNVTTTEGTNAKQCVKLAEVGTGLGACTCSPRAVGNGLGTPCGVQYGGGGGILAVCKGQSSCTAIGQYPTPCDAPQPASETCDNQDNDCDGKTDQGTCDDHNPCTLDLCSPGGLNSGPDGCEHPPTTAACDDGDPCTNGDSCANGTCKPGTPICACKVNADCAKNEDGNLCNGTLYCDTSALPHACKVNPATVVSCDLSGDTTCLTTACTPATGQCAKAPAKNGTACEADGNKCTPDDSCQAGKCTLGTNLCDCKATADCASKEDGNPCNGTLFCNKVKGVCELNPATVVTCPSVDNTACIASACDPKTGACALKPKNTGGACDDGNPCTTGDACEAGKCNPSANTCTCASDADCGPKDDGDLCNGVLFCNKAKGVCQVNPATVVVCGSKDDTFCLADQCDKSTGKCAIGFAHQGQTCDDGNLCTGDDHCKDGACVATVNACACKIAGDCAKFEDGDWCNGTMHCQGGGCLVNPATVVSCPADKNTVCAHNLCKAASGQCEITAVNVGAACSDNEPCTVGDVCKAGACVPGGNVCPCLVDGDCGDGLACTTDVCLKSKGCTHVGDDGKCEDGEVCTVGDCEAGKGCVQLPVQVTCSDGSACTTGDACDSGKCAGKVKVVCDDKNGCTDDACDLSKGCTFTANAAGCDDGDLCTVKDGCKAGKCGGGGALDCSDGNACTVETCGAKSGCGYKVADCGDGNVCTADACDKAKGCGNVGVTGLCDDGNSCTVGDVCDGAGGGFCKAGKVQVPCDSGPCAKGKEEWWVKTEVLPVSVITTTSAVQTANAAFASVVKTNEGVFASQIGPTGPTASFQKISVPKVGGVGEIAVCSDSGPNVQFAASFSNALYNSTLNCIDNCGAQELVQFGVVASCASKGQDLTVAVGYMSPFAGLTEHHAWIGEATIKSGTFASWFDKEPGYTELLHVIANDGAPIATGFASDAKGNTMFAMGFDKSLKPNWKLPLPLNDLPVGQVGCQDLAVAVDGTGAMIVYDSTGVFRHKHNVGQNIVSIGRAGSDKILISGPATTPNTTIVMLATCYGAVVASWQIPNIKKAHIGPLSVDALGYDSMILIGLGASSNTVSIARLSALTFSACPTAGLCAALTPASCSDGNACTYDTCDPATGCVSLTVPNYCNDQNPCTTDTCAPKTGCAHAAVPDSSACTDNNACTTGDKCLAGKCAAPPTDCDDKNACTTDTCDVTNGCKNEAKTSGPCDDNNPCTFGDACTSGTCKPGQPLVDGSPCTGGKTCAAGKCGP